MKKIYALLTLLLLFITSCNEPEARRPIYRSDNSEIRGSIERNKKINAAQQLLFKRVMKKDSSLVFVSTPAGYWKAIQKTSPTNSPPKAGDKITFNYKIQTLEGTILYDEMELGTVDYLVDKEELLPALRYAVKDLSLGDIGTFLMPSFLCYGYQGDGEKIGINQPLRITLQLNSIKRAENDNESK